MEQVKIKQHFTFEMYAPTSFTDDGVPIVERVSMQMQGEDLSVTDVINKFNQFLRACGYNV